MGSQARSPGEVFGTRLQAVRKLKGWSLQQMAGALAELGITLHLTAIAKAEKGQRKVTLDEALAFAAVLGVSPLHLIVPLDNETELRVAPRLTAPALQARQWMRGQRPLTDDDDGRLFYAQTPDDDWDAIAPGVAARFANRDEFEQARREYERDVTRAAFQRWTQGGNEDD